jgi:N-methylhydantoinase A
MPRPQIERSALAGSSSKHAKIGERDVLVVARKGLGRAAIYDFLKLRPGNVIEGPAVIQTPITTIAVGDRQTAQLDGFRNIIVEF